AQRLGDGPPDVGLAVRDAATLEHERLVLARRRGRDLLGQAGLADPGLAEQQDEVGAPAFDGGPERVAEHAQLGVATDEGRVAAEPVARWLHDRPRLPRLDRLL